MRELPILGGLAAVLACVLGWELLPASDQVTDPSPSRPRPASAHADTTNSPDLPAGIVDSLLARPLFSSDRRLAPVSSTPAGAIEEIPRLTGIIIGPAGARAIFEDGSGRPKIAAQGDKLGRFTVGTIAPGQVSLIASEGERVLRPSFAKPGQGVGVPVASAAVGPAR